MHRRHANAPMRPREPPRPVQADAPVRARDARARRRASRRRETLRSGVRAPPTDRGSDSGRCGPRQPLALPARQRVALIGSSTARMMSAIRSSDAGLRPSGSRRADREPATTRPPRLQLAKELLQIMRARSPGAARSRQAGPARCSFPPRMTGKIGHRHDGVTSSCAEFHGLLRRLGKRRPQLHERLATLKPPM